VDIHDKIASSYGKDKVECYRLVVKYMRQPPALSSGVRISRRYISKVWILQKVKQIKSVSSMQFTP
jgi:hypothetical protein